MGFDNLLPSRFATSGAGRRAAGLGAHGRSILALYHWATVYLLSCTCVVDWVGIVLKALFVSCLLLAKDMGEVEPPPAGDSVFQSTG